MTINRNIPMCANKLLFFFAAVACLALASCGGGNGGNKSSKAASGGDSVYQQEQAAAEAGENSGCQPVDLGLSVKWSSCNMGASAPEQTGGFFGWADPEGTNIKDNVWDDYGKWKSEMYGGVNPPKEISGTDLDIAKKKLGDGWRLPTAAEVQELCTKCKLEWTSQNKVDGMKVTGPNGASIFLPFTGYRFKGKIHNTKDDYTAIWTGTLGEGSSDEAWCLRFEQHGKCRAMHDHAYRYFGYSIRPVCK
jgi:hypothetical protein